MSQRCGYICVLARLQLSLGNRAAQLVDISTHCRSNRLLANASWEPRSGHGKATVHHSDWHACTESVADATQLEYCRGKPSEASYKYTTQLVQQEKGCFLTACSFRLAWP